MFYDRIEAGERLASVLSQYKGRDETIVLALPRGGVVPAYVIAKELNLPLEVSMVKKLGHPSNPEYAIGAVSLRGRVLNGHIHVEEEYIQEETRKIRKLLNQRYKMYHGEKPIIELKDKTVIVVDDGIATGKTLMACIELIRKEDPRQIIVAIPVGPTETVEELHHFADKVICLETYDDFYAIGMYYDKFDQVSDEDVKRLLRKANRIDTHEG